MGCCDRLTAPWTKGYKFDAHNWQEREAIERRPLPYQATSAGGVVDIGSEQYSEHRQNVVVNLSTQRIYRPYSKKTLALRSFSVLITNVFYSLARTIYYLVRIPFEMIYTFFEKIAEMAKGCKKDTVCGSVCSGIKNIFVETGLKTLGCAWEVLRSVFYGIGVQFAAFEGAFINHRKGAAKIGAMERKLHHLTQDSDPLSNSMFRKKGCSGVIFQAPWAQPIGKMTQHASVSTDQLKFSFV
ncbi:MAG: hypothetical protein MRY21_08190 [Simkaniaceae bacterium]|nr:hypothetical protein [Simkaniaceae bacterium]